MKHALVNKDNKVVNIVIWEGAEWLPPKDHYVVKSDKAEIGHIYDKKKNKFIKD